MPFPEKVKEDALVACGRHCCICHKFCGNKIEIHHIKPRAKGGADSFDNAIPLCFDCHAEVGQYNSEHPKGTKFSEAELKRHRDNWYKLYAQGKTPENQKKQEKRSKFNAPGLYSVAPPDYMTRIYSGQQLAGLLYGKYSIDYFYDEPATDQEQSLIAECIQYITDYLDFVDSDDISFRMKCNTQLTKYINDLECNGYWLFAVEETLEARSQNKEASAFPMLHIGLKRKTSTEIINIDMSEEKEHGKI